MFAAIGEPFDYEILDRSRWTPRAMVADTWRDRRVLLAGDAAHVWVPMGGFGMNAGIADAVSLSWRLAATLDGWAGDRLLDSYQAERAPIGDAIAGQAVTWALNAGIVLAGNADRIDALEADGPDAATARAELADALRRDTLSEFECPGFQLGYVYTDSPVIVTDDFTPPATTAVVDYRATSWPGSRLPHVWVADGVSVFDLLGPGFTLLRIGPGTPTGAALVAAATEQGIPLDIVDLDAETAGDNYDHIPLILVRPDQHIAWRSRTEPTRAEADSVLARTVGVRCFRR